MSIIPRFCYNMFKTVHRMVKTNQDIIGEKCIRNNDGVLAVSHEGKKIAWKSYHEKLLNTALALNKNSFSQIDTVNSVPCLIDREMVRDLVKRMKKKERWRMKGWHNHWPSKSDYSRSYSNRMQKWHYCKLL